MKTINLNELRDRAHKNAVEKGFWEEERPIESYLMLVICEIAEAVEADRKNRRAISSKFKEIITRDNGTEVWEKVLFPDYFETYIKDTVEDELADVAIRLLDLAGKFNLDSPTIAYSETNRYTCEYFAESAYNLTDRIARVSVDNEWYNAAYLLSEVFSFAESQHIDLLWHIEQKMKYNETREYKHGKEY